MNMHVLPISLTSLKYGLKQNKYLEIENKLVNLTKAEQKQTNNHYTIKFLLAQMSNGSTVKRCIYIH